MATVAPALVYAIFVWWFSTGLALLVVLRLPRAAALAGAVVVVPVSLWLLGWSSARADLTGAYLGFTAAILLWGAQEIAFLTGLVTGPQPTPLRAGARGLERLRAALGAILYHELGLIGFGLVVAAITAGAPNQTGALVYLVLWLMRISAKLNLFLGVPITNATALPPRVAFLASYFRTAPASGFFPLSFLAACAGLGLLAVRAARPDLAAAAQSGAVLVAGLMGLAILEHAFMLLPLPIDRLWAWSGGAARRTSSTAPREPGPERVIATLP